MGLLGEVQAEQGTSRPGLPCVVVRVREGLKGQDLKDFEAALMDPAIQLTALRRVLVARGFHIPRNALNRHRSGDCGCARR